MNYKALFVVTLTGFLLFAGLNYYQGQQYNSLAGKYNSLTTRYNSLLTTHQTDRASMANLRLQLNLSSAAYNNLLTNYSRHQVVYQGGSANQSLNIWGIPQTVGPHGFIEWELLDTFDNRINLLTNSTANVLTMGIFQFVDFDSGQPYAVIYNSTSTSFHYDSRISEGCSGYVLVIRNPSNASMQVIPNVTATYEPTPFLTGFCGV